MSENPYRAPAGEPTKIDSSDEPRASTPTREARLIVLAVLLVASLTISRFLHFGDLYSLFRVSIPIFLLSVLAYYFGLRHGAR